MHLLFHLKFLCSSARSVVAPRPALTSTLHAISLNELTGGTDDDNSTNKILFSIVVPARKIFSSTGSRSARVSSPRVRILSCYRAASSSIVLLLYSLVVALLELQSDSTNSRGIVTTNNYLAKVVFHLLRRTCFLSPIPSTSHQTAAVAHRTEGTQKE